MNDALMIRNVSDTASWVAMYRAREADRANALFHDPFARRLAGERGAQIAAAKQERNEWAFVIRTFLFDAFITQEIANGADTVLNLAAGLDARPYRLTLPPSLQWIEVDLPELIAHKEEILRDETPRCPAQARGARSRRRYRAARALRAGRREREEGAHHHRRIDDLLRWWGLGPELRFSVS